MAQTQHSDSGMTHISLKQEAKSKEDKDYLGYYDVVEDLYTANNLKTYFDSNPLYDSYDISEKLFNYPYHLMESVDMPINSKVKLGRQFMEKISSNARILYITPGSPSYAPEMSKKMKEVFKDILYQGNVTNGMKQMINDNMDDIKGKYFDFRNDYTEYMLYVNGICRALALYLGIGDNIGPDGKTPLKRYCWQNHRYAYDQGSATAEGVFNNDYSLTTNDGDGGFSIISEASGNVVEYIKEQIFGDWQYTQFYMDTNSTFSESYGNNTSESMIKSKLDTASAHMREAAFLANAGGQNISKFKETVDDALSKLTAQFSNLDGLMGRLVDGAHVIMNGSQMVFPSMWDSFNRDKTYSLQFYLHPPYGDTQTVFEETWVPLIHLMCYCLPKQVKNNPNAVGSPFLVRCFCKGMFSCQMGLVTSMMIDKSDNVNANNLASRIKVTMYIRDLYDEFAISPSNKPISFFNNESLMEFLAVTAGIHLGVNSAVKRLELFSMLVQNSIRDIPVNVYNNFIEKIRNVSRKIFG